MISYPADTSTLRNSLVQNSCSSYFSLKYLFKFSCQHLQISGENQKQKRHLFFFTVYTILITKLSCTLYYGFPNPIPCMIVFSSYPPTPHPPWLLKVIEQIYLDCTLSFQSQCSQIPCSILILKTQGKKRLVEGVGDVSRCLQQQNKKASVVIFWFFKRCEFAPGQLKKYLLSIDGPCCLFLKKIFSGSSTL